ncbi:coiled-coil domain-containing protein 89-like [Clytia hemisphaerica]|uniref:coiled-coil domain-containing protein 89-like n=1 Tax=Clytia hemisphaerica TaxID=252671 RepID=UPI0034D5298A
MSIRISEEPPKNKEEFLQSRIDQQVELICILKQRADEYLQKYLTNEEQVKTLRNDLEKTQNEHSSEVEKCKLLKRNISELEERWKKVKDQNGGLEQENVGLRNRCRELEENNEELNTQCEKLKVELEDIPGACAEKMRKLDEDLQQQLNQSQDVARKFQEYLALQQQLPSYVFEKERQSMKQDLNAYKDHAQKLLNREQELNAKLRRLSPKSFKK